MQKTENEWGRTGREGEDNGWIGGILNPRHNNHHQGLDYRDSPESPYFIPSGDGDLLDMDSLFMAWFFCHRHQSILVPVTYFGWLYNFTNRKCWPNPVSPSWTLDTWTHETWILLIVVERTHYGMKMTRGESSIEKFLWYEMLHGNREDGECRSALLK